MLVDAIVAGVLDQGGFSSSSEAYGWVNEVYKRAVAESHWQMQEQSLGNTVAAQRTYAVPESIVDVAELWLESADYPGEYKRVSASDLRSLRRGRLSLSGEGGVFAPSFSSVGVRQVELYPAPETSGVAIMVLAAVIPTTLVAGATPVVPEDMHGDLMDGAIALGLLRRDERPDSAAAFEAKLERMIAKLTRRKNSRIGSGASRMTFVR